jgi:hypothetical protein
MPRRLREIATEAVRHPRLYLVEHRVAALSRAVAHRVYNDQPGRSDRIEDHELSVSSQHGEDGILLWLFSKIGTTDRRFVEIGAGDGIECNTANLANNWGWAGLMIESDAIRFATAQSAHAGQPVRVRDQMVTAESINDLLAEESYSKSWDLLSIDIDGNDLWVWQAIHGRPRVVVVEYNASFGNRPVTIPYDAAFVQDKRHKAGRFFHGASLQALECVAARKGYRLVGCDSSGVNAFFVRGDCLGQLKALSADEAWNPHDARCRLTPQSVQEQLAMSLGVVQVE